MVKNLPAIQETCVQSLGWKIPWRREWQPTPEFLPREFHGQRSLVDYSLRGLKESDTTQQIKNNIALSWSLDAALHTLSHCLDWKQPQAIQHHWRRKWQPTPVPLPRKFHGWRSLVGYSPWGHKELDMTEQLHLYSTIAEKFISVENVSMKC